MQDSTESQRRKKDEEMQDGTTTNFASNLKTMGRSDGGFSTSSSHGNVTSDTRRHRIDDRLQRSCSLHRRSSLSQELLENPCTDWHVSDQTTWTPKSRFIYFVEHAFYFSAVMYIIVVVSLGTIVIYYLENSHWGGNREEGEEWDWGDGFGRGSPNEKGKQDLHMSLIDAYFYSLSCFTQAGLSVNNWPTRKLGSHIASLFLMSAGSIPLLSCIPPMLRRYNFRKQNRTWRKMLRLQKAQNIETHLRASRIDTTSYIEGRASSLGNSVIRGTGLTDSVIRSSDLTDSVIDGINTNARGNGDGSKHDSNHRCPEVETKTNTGTCVRNSLVVPPASPNDATTTGGGVTQSSRTADIQTQSLDDNLSQEQPVSQQLSMEDLDCCLEYRALGLVIKTTCIFKTVCVFGGGILIYLAFVFSAEADEFPLWHSWHAFYLSWSAFHNNGLLLTQNSCEKLQAHWFCLFVVGLLVLAGNTAFPIMLRYVILLRKKWLERRLSMLGRKVQEAHTNFSSPMLLDDIVAGEDYISNVNACVNASSVVTLTEGCGAESRSRTDLSTTTGSTMMSRTDLPPMNRNATDHRDSAPNARDFPLLQQGDRDHDHHRETERQLDPDTDTLHAIRNYVSMFERLRKLESKIEVYQFLLDNPRRIATMLFPESHTRWLLLVVIGLIIACTFCMYTEDHNSEAFSKVNIKTSLSIFINCLFQSVATRTAGFNSIELGHLSIASNFLLAICMYIAASPTVVVMRGTAHLASEPSIVEEEPPQKIDAKNYDVPLDEILCSNSNLTGKCSSNTAASNRINADLQNNESVVSEMNGSSSASAVLMRTVRGSSIARTSSAWNVDITGSPEGVDTAINPNSFKSQAKRYFIQDLTALLLLMMGILIVEKHRFINDENLADGIDNIWSDSRMLRSDVDDLSALPTTSTRTFRSALPTSMMRDGFDPDGFNSTTKIERLNSATTATIATEIPLSQFISGLDYHIGSFLRYVPSVPFSAAMFFEAGSDANPDDANSDDANPGENQKKWRDTYPHDTFFKVLYEICSAYGTVGLSLGGGSKRNLETGASFSGAWYPLSKFFLCLIMFLGKLRGLPDSIDPSVRAGRRTKFKEVRRHSLSQV